MTPEGEGSACRDSDSSWETEWCQSSKMNLALALHPFPKHGAAWERAEAHRADVLPTGSTHSHAGIILPMPSRADMLVAPKQQLSLGTARLAGTLGQPQPHSWGHQLPFLKQQQNPPNFAFQKSFSLSKGKEGPTPGS